MRRRSVAPMRCRSVGLMLLVALAFACTSRAPAGEVGGIYSIASDSGGFGVVKILALDPGVVHVRLYANQFATRPTQLDPTSLHLGRIGDPGGLGIGHLPLSESHFAAWQPALVARATVSEGELAGYREWKANGGGVWGR